MPIRKSSISGSSGIPSGTTADRPASPSIGDQFYNGTLGVLEIYTATGWLPATGANDFNVVLTGSETSVTLDKEYFSGAYTISSSLSDTTFDVYLFDTQDNTAGYSNSPSIDATSNFNKIVVYGGTAGDLLAFSYKTTFTTQTSSSDTFAAPYIISIDNAELPNIDDSVTITGGNFDTDVQVWFDGQNNYSQQAKSVVYGSTTSIVAVRPDDLLQDNSPYTLRVVKPGIVEQSTNKHKLINAITAGADPVWSTASGALPKGTINVAYSYSIAASDAADSGTVSYSLLSGSLPTGLSLNSLTGEIAGISDAFSYGSFVIRATDSGGNTSDRSFILSYGDPATGGTVSESNGYVYHTFTSNGDFVLATDLTCDILVVGGGGGGGGYYYGGGGGAGGYITSTNQSVTAGTYQIAIGAGATAVNQTQARGNLGTNTTAFSLTALGGGGGGYNDSLVGLDGGSGGGAGGSQSNAAAGGSGTQPSSASGGFGNRGGNTNNVNYGGYGGGAGGGGAGAQGTDISGNSQGGAGGIGLQWLDSNYYAGGGGGGGGNAGSGYGGAGGQGGGGSGASTSYASSVSGAPNTGGGGGGGQHTVYGNGGGSGGGSGIVIVRYVG